MLPPEYLAGCSDDIARIWAETEAEILSDIARRIAKTGKITDTAAWQTEKARQIGMLNTDVKKALQKAYGTSSDELDKLFMDAAKIAMETDNKIFLAAGIEASALEFTPAYRAIVLQGTKAAKMLLESYTHTTAQASELAFRNAADKAYLGIMSGAVDGTTAIRRAVNELAKADIEKIAYPTGKEHSMEAATRRAIVTGCNQSVAKLQLARAEDFGCELVEVTSHAGARPSHAEWQGKVYCIHGKSGKYKDLVDATGYGTGDGLCGWNCYHNFYPYFEGLSRRAFSEDPSADAGHTNQEDYENSQRQRALERSVREAKKECVVLDSAIKTADADAAEQLSHDFQQASIKLKRRETQLSEFIDKTGRTRLNGREQSPGFNRSVSSKAVWANKKENEFQQILAIAGKSATIELSPWKTILQTNRLMKSKNWLASSLTKQLENGILQTMEKLPLP